VDAGLPLCWRRWTTLFACGTSRVSWPLWGTVREGRGARLLKGRATAAGHVAGPGGQAAPGPGRQFRHVKRDDRGVTAAGDPVFALTRERRSSSAPSLQGLSWRPKGDPAEGPRPCTSPTRNWARVPRTGKMYEHCREQGFVSVGTKPLTPAAFAASAIRGVWRAAVRGPATHRLAATAGHRATRAAPTPAGAAHGWELAGSRPGRALGLTFFHFRLNRRVEQDKPRLFCHITPPGAAALILRRTPSPASPRPPPTRAWKVTAFSTTRTTRTV